MIAGTVEISGVVKPGFEPVREAFRENFSLRGELGAACCVYHRGKKVVDLWGGVRCKSTGAPWEEGTMCLVYSTTKGLSGLAMALAHSRGLFDYEERVCAYWPEFAQNGKEAVTVRQLLAHQAGLYALDEKVDRALLRDFDRLAAVLARQKPAWPPGTRQAYHGLTLGWYEGELLRRVDPARRTLGRFFQEEIAGPLGIDFYIRLPEDIPDSRLAVLERVNLSGAFGSMPFALALSGMFPGSRIRRALRGSELAEDPKRIYSRDLEIPAGGGVGTARAIARAYGAFAAAGGELGLRTETLRLLAAPPVPPLRGFRDACLKVPIAFSLGFSKPTPENPWAGPGAFGAPGAGGSSGFADPESKIGFGYVPNQMAAALDDPRGIALREAVFRSPGLVAASD